jgi:hypothetical protein
MLSVPSYQLGWINVLDYSGLVPGGDLRNNDWSAAISAAFAAAGSGGTVYFPKEDPFGTPLYGYQCHSAITLPWSNFHMVGESITIGNETSGVLFAFNNLNNCTFRGITWSNDTADSTSICIRAGYAGPCVGLLFINCGFNPGNGYGYQATTSGVNYSDAAFDVVFSEPRINGVGANAFGSGTYAGVGLALVGSHQVYSPVITGCAEGIRCYGGGITVTGVRGEVNGIAVRVGTTPTGAPNGYVTNGQFGPMTLESNDCGIQIDNASYSTFSDITGIGNPATYRNIKYGIWAQQLGNCVFRNISYNVNINIAAIRKDAGFGNIIENVLAGSGGNFYAPAWQWNGGLNTDRFINCNFTYSPGDVFSVSPDIVRYDGVPTIGVGSLQSLSPINGYIQGFNLTNKETLGNGVTTKAVLFTASKFGAVDNSSAAATGAGSTFTVTIASPAVITQAAHGYGAGQAVTPTTTGSLPTGLTAGTIVYVSATGLTTNTYQVAVLRGDALNSSNSINTSGSQSGTHTMTPTLAAGTYYYLGQVMTKRGARYPLYGSGEVVVTVSGANNSVNIVMNGSPAGTAGDFKYRVFRGRATGVYDGYFELPLNSVANYTDNGQWWSGGGSLQTNGVDESPMQEPDVNYRVFVEPSWLTTHRVTSKATSGFTVDFGTATPDANQTIDWFIVR